MGFGVACNYWWQGQNAFSEKQIGELLRFVGQGTGADEWAGFCFRAEFELKYFVFVDAVIFGGLSFLEARRTCFNCGGDSRSFAGGVDRGGLLD
jgi:hypothetical protein